MKTLLLILSCVCVSAQTNTNYSALVKSNQISAARSRIEAARLSALKERNDRIQRSGMWIVGTASKEESGLSVLSGGRQSENAGKFVRSAGPGRWEAGLFVYRPESSVMRTRLRAVIATNNVYVGSCLVMDYPFQDRVKSGDAVRVFAYYNGDRKVGYNWHRFFTCDPSKVTMPADDVALEQLKDFKSVRFEIYNSGQEVRIQYPAETRTCTGAPDCSVCLHCHGCMRCRYGKVCGAPVD
jgi:hypothetical protein